MKKLLKRIWQKLDELLWVSDQEWEDFRTYLLSVGILVTFFTVLFRLTAGYWLWDIVFQ